MAKLPATPGQAAFLTPDPTVNGPWTHTRPDIPLFKPGAGIGPGGAAGAGTTPPGGGVGRGGNGAGGGFNRAGMQSGFDAFVHDSLENGGFHGIYAGFPSGGGQAGGMGGGKGTGGLPVTGGPGAPFQPGGGGAPAPTPVPPPTPTPTPTAPGGGIGTVRNRLADALKNFQPGLGSFGNPSNNQPNQYFNPALFGTITGR